MSVPTSKWQVDWAAPQVDFAGAPHAWTRVAGCANKNSTSLPFPRAAPRSSDRRLETRICWGPSTFSALKWWKTRPTPTCGGGHSFPALPAEPQHLHFSHPPHTPHTRTGVHSVPRADRRWGALRERDRGQALAVLRRAQVTRRVKPACLPPISRRPFSFLDYKGFFPFPLHPCLSVLLGETGKRRPAVSLHSNPQSACGLYAGVRTMYTAACAGTAAAV